MLKWADKHANACGHCYSHTGKYHIWTHYKQNSNFLARLCSQTCLITSCRDFPRLIWGQINAPSQLKNEQKLPKMVYIIPNYLLLHFGENFMEIWSKIQNLQMHEKLHKNVNEFIHAFMQFVCKWSFYTGSTV